MRVLTVLNYKGGSGKTTTSGYVVHGLQHLGYRAAAVDVDPQASMSRWAKRTKWSIPTVHLNAAQVRDLTGYVDPATTDVVVIDTPPIQEQRKFVEAALSVSTDGLVPLAPTYSDFDSLPQVWAPLRNSPVPDTHVSVLMNRVRGQVGHRTYRKKITEAGHHVLTKFVPGLELYAQALAFPVEVTSADYYRMVAEEVAAHGGWKTP
uniref:ParA family protein n=1 Tax=Amycolatopsis sp. CA-290885 TaxID=3239925 RepID=UPI003F495E57